MNWENLFRHTRSAFYTEFLMEFICILIILFYLAKGRHKTLIYLPIIAAASLIQILTAHYDLLSSNKTIFGKFAKNHSIYLYLIFESTCCLLFLRSSITSPLIKKVLLACSIAFGIYSIVYWVLYYSTWQALPFIQNIEGFLIIVTCLYYFYELFTVTPHKNLATGARIWVISGMLALFTAITPLFLFLNYLTKNDRQLADRFYLINNIGYTLFFLTFLLAIFIDSKKKTT